MKKLPTALECARAFGLGAPEGELELMARGQVNPLGVFRLNTDRGAFAIKCLETPPTDAAIHIESCALAAGVPIPRPLPSVDGAYVVRHGDAEHRIWFRAYPWMEGEPGAWGQINESASFDVGRLMAMVHGLEVSPSALDEEPWVPPTRAGWQRLATTAVGRGLDWGELLREKMSLLTAAQQAQFDGAPELWYPSQRDYHPPNLITLPEGSRVLTDWDTAGPAVAQHEVVKFALIWATGENREPERALVRACVAGYQSAGGTLRRPTAKDMLRHACPNVWWIWFNMIRDLEREASPYPGLTQALLEQVHAIDSARLEQWAALFLE